MKRPIISAIIFLAFCFVATASADAQTVTGTLGKGGIVTRGTTARGNIVINIPDGLHVNSNRPSSEYAIPTVVTIKATGVKASRATYPRGRNRKFQFSENLINVYEGRVNFPFTVKVPANFKGNTIRVNASVRYQACTEEVCYPPRTRSVLLTAKVR